MLVKYVAMSNVCEELDVALASGNGGDGEVGDEKSGVASRIDERVEHANPDVWVSDDAAALAHLLFARFELGLDENDEVARGGELFGEDRKERCRGNERQVGNHDIEGIVGVDGADVGVLKRSDPVIYTKTFVELVRADVDGNDMTGSLLQQTVGEAAGRRASIEGATAIDAHPERFESAFEFLAAAADETRRRTTDNNRFGG